MRRFWEVLETVREPLDAAVLKVASGLPAFAGVLASLDPGTAKQRAADDRARERSALVEGNWSGYLEGLREQGKAFARMGIAFRDWRALLSPYRRVIWQKVIPPGLGDLSDVLSGMNTFLDIAMSGIAEAYIETKQELVLAAERDLNLHVRMFESSTLGKLIYAWEAPPDEGSFRLLAANPAASAAVGRDLRELVGQRLGDLGLAEQVRETGARLAKAAEGEPQAWTLETSVPGGPARSFEVRAFSLGGPHVGVMFEDVTARREMERELERHVRDLERSNRDLDEFAYVASHDLKAPLRDIDNLSKWIVQDAGGVVPEKTHKHLSRLQDRVGRMERLLEDLLQYSRAGRVKTAPEEVDLRAAVSSAAALAALPEHFKLEVVGEAAPLRAPRAALELVLRNLMTNAVKHHDRKDGLIRVELADAANLVQLTFRDDGPGIPPQFHERVFRMFQTLRPRDEVEGSGMGLAIVKKTVEAHGGSIRLESVPPRGTAFHIRWPRRERA